MASSRNAASCTGLGAQPNQENQMPVNASEASVLQSPGHKRKHSESTVLLSPPQTPPHFRQLASCLSSVSPLHQASTDTQQDPASHRPDENTAAKKPSVIAKFDGNCRVCKERIRRDEDKIIFIYVRSNKYWIHEKCDKL